MGTLPATGPNAEQIQYWNDTAGPKWVTLHRLIDSQIAPLGLQTIDRAAPQAGERVVDVGCGCGETTMELARRVGRTGHVCGIDISTAMLEHARHVARQAGLEQIRFANADAQTHAFEPASCDLLYSRFGVMFFVDPVAAFTNLQGAVRAGGRLAFVCWQTVHKNPWMFVPMAAALQHVSMPAPPAPDAPGPFAFADPARVRIILSRAGFADVGVEDLSQPVIVGGGADLDATVDFLMQMGPAAAALREVDPSLRQTVAGSIRDALVPYRTADGIRMDAAAWIVTARRP